ncbi:MAG: ABC transporter permease [Lachnospiraceae bacterium]|nr:ABC transporter permease [Lachnospiraceae bacterium]
MSNGRFDFHEMSDNIEIDHNFSGQNEIKEKIYRFQKNKGAVVGFILIVLIILLAIFGPIISPYTHDAINTAYQNLPPRIPGLEKLGIFDGTWKGINVYEKAGLYDKYFYLGTDSLGRDIFTRVFSGARISLLIAVIAAGVDMIIGVTYGLICGYYGGKVDIIMQRLIEIIHSIPRLVIVTMLMIVLKPGVGSIIVALLISGWIGMSCLVRAQTLKLKEQEYVLACRTLGVRDRNIIFGEILPNTFGQIIIMTMTSIPSAIFMESFLSYIGLGIPAPQASLGSMISDGYKTMLTYPYQLLVPAVLFAVLMIALNLVADGIRDALDPKMKDM